MGGEFFIPEDEIKKDIFKNILTKEYESSELPEEIFILSGGIKRKKGEREDYKTLSYGDEDINGLVTGGKARVVAAAALGKVLPELKFVTTSRVEADAPTHAEVMAQEMVKRGISPDHILLEENSNNTVTELAELVKMAVANNWSRVAIISSGYHLPRVKSMFEKLESIVKKDDSEFYSAIKEFKKREVEVTFVSAEEVLSNVSPKYEHLIDRVKDTEGYQKRLEAEKQGLDDLEAGVYNVGPESQSEHEQ